MNLFGLFQGVDRGEFPLGVIAPVVPAVFQVLLPLLLIAGSALILAIPRWFLVFSHWLWLRVAPKSLINRSMPGVQARIFQGVAIKGFEDEYVLSMPDEGQDFRARVVAFFEKHGARIRNDGDGLSFHRGSRFCSYLLGHIVPCREKNFLQDIRVEFHKRWGNEMDVRVRYDVNTFYMLRISPAGLQDEIWALHGWLRTGTVA
ncbi:MAG: hypothetical protein V1809_15750 [Planctomycetota bacterium]